MPPTHFVDPFIVRGPLGVESLVSYGVRGAREAEHLAFLKVSGVLLRAERLVSYRVRVSLGAEIHVRGARGTEHL